jgi:class 3 adenylate cyclase/tetratricopeptide (TPR) repeat protein
VLFTDLVGSTELRTRLGEGAAEDLRRVHDRLLAEAVEANTGRVVKGLGDGIMATFAAASDAVAAAAAIQQSVDRRNRRGDLSASLAVRVGISLGDVTFEDDDVHGTTVIEAARLCAAAAGGQILAADLVRVLVGSSHAAGFAPVGPLDLKGLAEPVVACSVRWEPRQLSSIPLPAFLTDLGRIFVGRDDQLERLGQVWKEAAAGEGRITFLAGEPGVGKTRLAAELAARVYEDGATVLVGRCDEDLGVPYQPFVEALRQFVDHTPAGALVDRLGRYAGELGRLIPELPTQVPGLPPAVQSDPETERYRLFDAVAAWLGAVSADEPVLLVLDDLQWAAKPTLLLLRHVISSTDPRRLLVLATYRDTELGHDHPLGDLLADLRRQRAVERLSLLGLDSAGVAAYLEQAAGHALDDDDLVLARAIHEETEGNPFFVREVLRHLTETGAVTEQAGRWGVRGAIEDVGIPEGVREVVGRRLSRLSPGANRLLEAGAVAGLEFEMRILQAVEGLADDELVASFEEATESRLLTEVVGSDAHFRFAHALVRDTLYNGLSAPRRVTLHRRVAEAIETLHAAVLDDYLPALAHHWSRAAAPAAEMARAVDYATRAGDRALAQLAHDEAARYYRQGLELLGAAGGAAHDDRRMELLIGLGEAQRRAGDPACRTTLLEAGALARHLDRADAMARAALANSRGTFSVLGIVDTDRVEALEEALAALGEEDPARRARLLAILGVELLYSADQTRCRHLSDEALALARRVGDPRVIGSVIGLRWATLWDPRWAVERLHLADELLSLARVTADPSIRFWGLWRGHLAQMELGQTERAAESLEAARGQAAYLGHHFPKWCVKLSDVPAAVAAGRLDQVEEAIRELPDSWVADGATVQAAALASLYYEQGRMGEVEDLLLTQIERLPRVPLFQALLALAYLETGRVADARATFARFRPDPTEHVFDYFAGPTAAVLSLVCAELGDEDGAARLLARIAPYTDQIASHPGLWFGSFAHWAGLLATTLQRWPEADAYFATASATHQRIGAATWLARTRVEWARMLLAAGNAADRERARNLLHEALGTARRAGLLNIERRAAELLLR